MGRNVHGTGTLPSITTKDSIVEANDADHTRMRKKLLPAFSEKAIRAQEGYINVHVNRLVSMLRKAASNDEPVDVAKLFNLVTFDITGDLAFDESFGGLEKGDYHPWVGSMLGLMRGIPIIQMLNYYGIWRPRSRLMPPQIRAQHQEFFSQAFTRFDKRYARKTERRDFMGFIIDAAKATNEELPIEELRMNSAVLIVGGSETSATLLSAAIYYLLLYPEALLKVCNEIRTAFQHEDDIDGASAASLQYLGYVIQESFRMHPPQPGVISRLVPSAGETIAGKWVPAGTYVSISQWATNHLSSNFRDAECFVPERWLPLEERPEEYKADHLDAVQPFSYGNRNCVGQTLAETELRLILCRLLYSFDMIAQAGHADWTKCWASMSWVRKPLYVKLKARVAT